MKNKLKKTLLKLNLFECNTFLDKYIDLIIKNSDTKMEKFKTQKHHIIPKSYYQLKSIPIDNSNDNLVILKYSDHLLAHYYLTQFTIDEMLLQKLRSAFVYMLNIADKRYPLDIYDINLEEYQQVYESWKIQQSKTNRNKPNKKNSVHMKNTIWLTDGYKDIHVKLEEAEKYFNRGFIKGRSKLKGKPPWNKGLNKDDSRVSQNIANRKGDSIISKDGIIKLVKKEEIPIYIEKGWTRGRPLKESTKEKIGNANRDRKYINNGIINKMIHTKDIEQYLNMGWALGRINFIKHKHKKDLKQE